MEKFRFGWLIFILSLLTLGSILSLSEMFLKDYLTRPKPTQQPNILKSFDSQFLFATKDANPVVDCKEPEGSKCFGQSVKMKKSQCEGKKNPYICCEIGDRWNLKMSEEECRDEQRKNYLASDSVVNCTFKHRGSISMRKSQCSRSFECPIGGQYYIFESLDQCKRDMQLDIAIRLNKINQQYLEKAKEILSQRTNSYRLDPNRYKIEYPTLPQYEPLPTIDTSYIEARIEEARRKITEIAQSVPSTTPFSNQQRFYDMCVDIVKSKYDKYHLKDQQLYDQSKNRTIIEKYNDEISQCNFYLK